MCDKNPYFGPQVMCGFEVGGVCDIGNTSKCICKSDFGNDLTQLRQRDCSLHVDVMPVIITLALIGSIFTFFFTIKILLKATGTAKQILIFNCGCEFLVIVYSINHFINVYILDEFGFFCSYMLLSFAFSANYLTVYSLASPLYKLAEQSDESFKRALNICNFFFRAFGLIVTIVGFSAFGDHLNENNDHGWNLTYAILFFSFGLETLIINLIVQFVGKRIILAIEALINLTPENQNHVTTRQYVEKVRNLLKSFSISAPGFAFSWMAPNLIYLIFGYFPHFYIILAMTAILAPTYQFALTVYAKRVEDTKMGKVENKETPQEIQPKLDRDEIDVASNVNSSEGDKFDSKMQVSEFG